MTITPEALRQIAYDLDGRISADLLDRTCNMLDDIADAMDLGHLVLVDDAAVGRLETSFVVQMEAQADDTTPSSVHRDQGRVWLEGWFDLPAAIAAMGGK